MATWSQGQAGVNPRSPEVSLVESELPQFFTLGVWNLCDAELNYYVVLADVFGSLERVRGLGLSPCSQSLYLPKRLSSVLSPGPQPLRGI